MLHLYYEVLTGSRGSASVRHILHVYYEVLTGSRGPASVRHVLHLYCEVLTGILWGCCGATVGLVCCAGGAGLLWKSYIVCRLLKYVGKCILPAKKKVGKMAQKRQPGGPC